MVEHPMPAVATVKFLYAHALRCAYPKCSEPLYREDTLSGKWMLNSRICHICARSEGGPRWDERQTAEENRADGNLILMCTAHAAAIDEPRALSDYPAVLLREWKVAQIAEHRQKLEGWPLTEAMAKEALATSFSNSVIIKNSVVYLGGEGGRGPGSGGGGGGAIGPNSRAGRGGEGGRITDQDGRLLDERELAEYERELAEFMSGIPITPHPGAGGGGAGALGPGAIGGDGGSGGSGTKGSLTVEEGDTIEVEVGRGGKPGRLPGQHGTHGDDTILKLISADGKVKRVIRARGGARGESGILPEDWLPVSEADVAGGFQITTLLAANSIEVRDGLLFVLGGGWSTFATTILPVDVIWPIICVATWTELVSHHTRGVQLCLINPDGEEVSRIALDLPVESINGKSFKWVKSLGAPLDREGNWVISVKSGEFILSEIFINVSSTNAVTD